MSKVMKVGPFSFVHDAFCKWHDTRYQAIQEEGSQEHLEWLEKLAQTPPHIFFNNTDDPTASSTLVELVTQVASAKENDLRTKDKASLRKRMAKLSTTDDVYTVVPVAEVIGRNRLQQETYHLHKAVYVAIIDGVVMVDPELQSFIPLKYTIKVSRKAYSEEEFVSKINSHDNKSDVVTDAQVNAMLLGQMAMDKYNDHPLVKYGNSAVKKWKVKSVVAAFSDEIVGHLFRGYLDNTDGSHNFPSMERSIEKLLEEGRIEARGKGYAQAGFARGVVSRLLMAIEEEVLTKEEAVALLIKKMRVPADLSVKERLYLDNAARLTYNVPADGWVAKSPNAVENHAELGAQFIASAIRDMD